jgi:salicylate 5-hydroxylase large subunit
MSQQGFTQHPEALTLARLGGRDVAPTGHMVTETLIRGMHAYWQKVMAE